MSEPSQGESAGLIPGREYAPGFERATGFENAPGFEHAAGSEHGTGLERAAGPERATDLEHSIGTQHAGGHERAAGPGENASRLSVIELLRQRAIGPNVVALGFTSLFTDVSSEMVAAILPIWLVREMQFSTLEFGAIDGLWRGVAGILGALVALGSDARRRHKLVAATGYAISTASRFTMLLLPVAWVPVAIALFLDRFGKGIRTPPRDALISFASVPSSRATAFGVHRALDAVGRLTGPLIAFAVLKIAPGAFDAVFFVSICFALIGMATITLLVVEDRSGATLKAVDAQKTTAPVGNESSNTAARSLRTEDARGASSRLEAHGAGKSASALAVGLSGNGPFRWLLLSAAILSAVAIGEAFFVLVLERRGDISADNVPLFFTGIGLVQILFTLPCSRLADRIGRKRVWVAGHGVLLASYLVLLFGSGIAGLAWLSVLLVGLYLATTDGVSSALTSLLVPVERRAAGLAIVACAAGLAEVGASLGFGALWASHGINFSLGLFAMCAGIGILVAMFTPWSDVTSSHADPS